MIASHDGGANEHALDRQSRRSRAVAGTLSGLLIAAAIAITFVAAFFPTPSPAPPPAAVVRASIGERAPALPAVVPCQITRRHRCGNTAHSKQPAPTPPTYSPAT